MRRALRVSDFTLPPSDARAQGQGRAGRALRRAEFPRRPRVAGSRSCQRARPRLVYRDSGPADPWDDQGDAARPLRGDRACHIAPGAVRALRAGDMEASQAASRLPRRLRRRVLFGPASADRSAALDSGRRYQRPDLSRAPAGRESPPGGPPRPADHPCGSLAPGQNRRPARHAGQLRATRQRHWPRHQRAGRTAAGRAAARSAAHRPGHSQARAQVWAAATRGRVHPRPALRRPRLRHDQAHPRARLDQVPETAAPTPPCDTTLPLFARPVTDFFPSSGGSSCN